MLQTVKAIISFIQVLLLSAGIIPVNTNIDYGGGEYQLPQVTTPMYIVENGISFRELEDILVRKAAEGVEVRLL